MAMCEKKISPSDRFSEKNSNVSIKKRNPDFDSHAVKQRN